MLCIVMMRKLYSLFIHLIVIQDINLGTDEFFHRDERVVVKCLHSYIRIVNEVPTATTKGCDEKTDFP